MALTLYQNTQRPSGSHSSNTSKNMVQGRGCMKTHHVELAEHRQHASRKYSHINVKSLLEKERRCGRGSEED